MESGSHDPQPEHVNWVLREALAPGTGQPVPEPAGTTTVPATPGNLVLTILGASGGAAAGAVVWFLLEYFVRFQIGYVAILCGWLAGVCAVRVGNVRGRSVGVIAALAGGLGVLVGSYAAFQANVNQVDSQILTVPGLSTDLTPGAADEAEPPADDPPLAEPADDYPILDFYADHPGELAWILIFGIIGMGAGFAVGSAADD